MDFTRDEEETGGTKRPTMVTLNAVHPENGPVGFLRYHVPRRKADKILVDRLEVPPEHQGNGYASQLMDEMQRQHPNTPVDHGDRTDAGKAWWDSYTKGKSVSRGRTAFRTEKNQWDDPDFRHPELHGGFGIELDDNDHNYIDDPTKPSHEAKTAASEPYTFDYAHNTEKSPNAGEAYGQHIEPHGRYLTQQEKGGRYDDRYETGTLTFQKPKHMDFGGGYAEPTNWKRQLSGEYGGKKGKPLSRALVKDGYDGIVTHDEYGPSEIVDLTSFHKKASQGDWNFEHYSLEGNNHRLFGTEPGGDSREHMLAYKVTPENRIKPDQRDMDRLADHARAPMLNAAMAQHGVTEVHGPEHDAPVAPPKPQKKIYYHGTTAENVTHVLPATSHGGSVMFPHDTSRQHAYATTDKGTAWDYAEKAHAVTGGKPRVYQVRPIGGHRNVEPDPHFDEQGNNRGNSFSDHRSKHGFEVVRELKTPKDIHDNFDWPGKEDEG